MSGLARKVLDTGFQEVRNQGPTTRNLILPPFRKERGGWGTFVCARVKGGPPPLGMDSDSQAELCKGWWFGLVGELGRLVPSHIWRKVPAQIWGTPFCGSWGGE